MSNFNKSKTLLVTLLTCVAFSAHAAWWDAWKSAGDDGNINTKGNPQVVNKVYVGLVNDTKSILTSAVLKDKTGKVLYTSTAGRTCAAGAVCWLRLSPGLMTKGNTFFFYNNGKLVSALVLDNLPANASLYNIGASMDSLGLYVFNKIKAVNPKITYNRVDNDIQTTTLKATPYQELADYYLDLMGSSKDNTAQEAKVIKSMTDQFAKDQAIPANPATTRLAKSTPVMAKSTKLANGRMVLMSSPTTTSSDTQDALCSETLNTAMDWLSAVPMIGDVVATAAKTAQKASCPSGDQDVKDFMADRFADVNIKLQDISTQLTNLENQLKSFEQNYNKDKLSQQKTDVDIQDKQFTIWLENYQTALLTSRGKDGKQYNTLNELINSFGSFNKALAKNPNLGALLSKLYDDETEYQAIINLGGISAYFSTAKKDQICSNPDKIAGNVFEIRAACNAVVVAMYSKNIILAKQMAYAYNDVYKVYQIDTRSNKTPLQLMSSGAFTNWESNVEQMNPEKAITKPLGANEPVFNLVTNLKTKGFTVTGWYPEASKRYLDVSYEISKDNWIKSKYAYQHPKTDRAEGYDDEGEIDSNIANVMGVPVPERFFTGDGKSRNSYGANEAFPWTNSSRISGMISTYVTQYFIMPIIGRPAINAFSFHPENAYNGTMISPNNGFTEGIRKLFVPDGDGKYILQYSINDFGKIGSGEFFTLVRYTNNSTGYTYVWAMRTWLEKGTDPYDYEYFGAQQCMTNDCSVTNDGDSLKSLKFKNGATIAWTLENYHNFTINVK